MESPPSSSTWSEAFILSDDSGLLLTSGSISSGSMSSCYPGLRPIETLDSDCEDKSLSQDSLDGMSDVMCGENFNTLKKGPHFCELPLKHTSPIEPPPEFQDQPIVDHCISAFAEKSVAKIIAGAIREYMEIGLARVKMESLSIGLKPSNHLIARSYFASDFLSFSPCHGGRPTSRCSLGSSRLSSSHNSLSVPTACRVDDSSFIMQAVSHDTLSSNQISDLYNVPFDSDVYAVPVDVVKPPLQPKRTLAKRKRRYTSSGCREWGSRCSRIMTSRKIPLRPTSATQRNSKRHSVAGTSSPDSEPIHMTLQEVRQYLQTLYSSSSDSDNKERNTYKQRESIFATNNNEYPSEASIVLTPKNMKDVSGPKMKSKRNSFFMTIKNKKIKDSCDNSPRKPQNQLDCKESEQKKNNKLLSLKQALCSVFRIRRLTPAKDAYSMRLNYSNGVKLGDKDSRNSLSNRALPPLPGREEPGLDFATSIHKVKDYGWYWGPLSSEVAEKILSNEPDGSFIVRDSSDDHYIFSLTLKLEQSVRHVRIEHDQGNFSFGSCTKFKSRTIVEFIENAVEHSRSGRYLFFLNRRPLIGPVRVQLLHPVSRFKQIQSLQHMCRFVILKEVRRDLIPSLPLPRRMIDYLNTPHYYSEHLFNLEEPEEASVVEVTDEGDVDHDEIIRVNDYVTLHNSSNRNSTPGLINARQS